jgi:hypothetical protein
MLIRMVEEWPRARRIHRRGIQCLDLPLQRILAAPARHWRNLPAHRCDRLGHYVTGWPGERPALQGTKR